MRILIIGGTRFIGPYVIRELASLGHKVTVYHRGEHEAELPAEVQHVHAPSAAMPVLQFPLELRKAKPEVVLHMMPIGERDALIAVDAFRGVARRLVVISSADVYRAYGVLCRSERALETTPLTEESPLRKVLYPHRDAAKVVGEWAKSYDKILVERTVMSCRDLPATVLRLPAVYGPGDQRFLPYLQRMQERAAMLLGEEQAQWRWTHGYVENVAHAIVTTITNKRAAGRVYNVGEEATPTMEQRLRHIAELTGWKGEIVKVPQENLPPHLRDDYDYAQDMVCDTSRIRRELGFEEPVSYVEGLRRTVEWQLANMPEQKAEGAEAARNGAA